MTCCQSSVKQTSSDKGKNWDLDQYQHDKVKYDIIFNIFNFFINYS